jgi:hypothetical protein
MEQEKQQLTIFYGRKVLVFDDLPDQQGKGPDALCFVWSRKALNMLDSGNIFSFCHR